MISIKNLSFSYPKCEPLFAHLSMEIGTGNIVGLFGKNGSGKTTLLKLLCGLLFKEQGQLQVMGYSPEDRLPSFLENVFLIPEEFELPPITIEQFILANSRFYPLFDHGIMHELLDLCELSSGNAINKLSFGQKKKFYITFGLATKCRLLLLDEPTNGLDIPSKSVFRKITAGSLDEDQLVIISTHQVKDIDSLIDRMIILDQGQLMLDKSLFEISEQVQFGKVPSMESMEVIYSETTPEGYHVISPQVNGDSSIDIELLFNAVTNGKKIF